MTQGHKPIVSKGKPVCRPQISPLHEHYDDFLKHVKSMVVPLRASTQKLLDFHLWMLLKSQTNAFKGLLVEVLALARRTEAGAFVLQEMNLCSNGSK